jgi:hypothetical protein
VVLREHWGVGSTRGPSPFEIGDLGPLRRRPKGWLAARAMPVHHRAFADPYSGDGTDGGGSDVETSTRLDVLWEVTIPGQAPYQFHEVRKSPLWATPNALGGTGDRFYKIKLKKSHGFQKELGVPCLVDPEDPHRLWVDWDAAYDEHVPVWDRISAVEREVAKRANPWDHAFTRVFDPFARKVRPDEEHLVDQAIAEQQALEERQRLESIERAEQMNKAAGTWTSPEEQAEFQVIADDLTRIFETGTASQATVVSITKTDRTVANVPVFEIHLDVHDTNPPRRLLHVQVMGDNRFFLRRFKPGKQLAIHIDPNDADKVCIG